MIGTSSLILESLAALFPLTILLLAVYWPRSGKQKGGIVFVAFAGVMLFLMGSRYYAQLSNHRLLSRLSAGQVARIEVGRSEISKGPDIELVVAALNERKWFSSSHGGWGQTVPLRIIMKDGRTHQYAVGYYLRQEGAVIQFFRDWGGVRWYDGYAFSERLPAVLKQSGVALPAQE